MISRAGGALYAHLSLFIGNRVVSISKYLPFSNIDTTKLPRAVQSVRLCYSTCTCMCGPDYTGMTSSWTCQTRQISLAIVAMPVKPPPILNVDTKITSWFVVIAWRAQPTCFSLFPSYGQLCTPTSWPHPICTLSVYYWPPGCLLSVHLVLSITELLLIPFGTLRNRTCWPTFWCWWPAGP